MIRVKVCCEVDILTISQKSNTKNIKERKLVLILQVNACTTSRILILTSRKLFCIFNYETELYKAHITNDKTISLFFIMQEAPKLGVHFIIVLLIFVKYAMYDLMSSNNCSSLKTFSQ